MGLMDRMHQERRKQMDAPLELSPAEAAVALAALVSFADDDPSEAEGAILRRYYRHATAEQLQRKLDQAGITYPSELPSIEEPMLKSLGESPVDFRTRTIAVAWLLAQADGVVDQAEIKLLAAYATALDVALTQARAMADAGMQEVDETHDETAASTTTAPIAPPPSLQVTEAAAALAAWVGFADDDPSDDEAAVMREYFTRDEVESLQKTMKDAGLSWPGSLPLLEGGILHALSVFSRQEQLRALAIAYKVASADGDEEPGEVAILGRFCEELGIGMAEVTAFFSASPE